MKRLLILAALLLPSCTAPNLLDPTATFISEQVVADPDGTARAFRVEIEEKESPAPRARYTLSPISLEQGNLVPQQSCSFPVSDIDMLARKSNSKYAVLVRVYRPCYRTIEIRAGFEEREWKWTPADFLEQEKAIDALLGVRCVPDKAGWWELVAVAPHTELSGSSWPDASLTIGDSGLLPGSVSAKHRDVLLFAAAEYQRLAKSSVANSPNMEKTRHRLEWKASQINRYANELTTEEFYRKQFCLTTR